MINIILHWTGDWALLFDEENTLGFIVNYAKVNEMIPDYYTVNLQQADDFDALELAMETQSDVTVVGTYNEDGTQYLWGTETSRNHTIQKYHAGLQNKKEYDQDGNITLNIPYTEAEAATVSVTKFYGWEDRQL